MPKSPDDKRVIFPFLGVSDRFAYLTTPGDMAPMFSILNVRPTETIGGRTRGGKRPPLRQVRDAAGEPWGRLGNGPVQSIRAVARAAQVTGFKLGAGVATHTGWESRGTGDLVDNLYILRNKDASPYLSRSHSFGSSFDVATDRDLACVVWTGAAALAGCVVENPAATDLDDLLFKASYTNGAANNGFGSPGWTAIANWDTGGSVYSTNGGPWPTRAMGCFYGDATLGRYLFASGQVTAGNPVGEPMNKGYLVAYDVPLAAVAAVAAGKVARLRLFGRTYKEGTPGTPSTLTIGSVVVNTGAINIPHVRCEEVAGVKAVYFVYDAVRRAEAMVGRVAVTALATTGLDLTLSTGGAFQTNGAGFGVRASNFTVPASPLDPHYLSVNYPRGGKPTAVAVDPDGYVYFTCSSSGEGWFPDSASANYRADHHPDFEGHRPITICKVDPSGTMFLWEAVTNYDTTQSGYARIADPELVWCEADGDGCYVGGRTVADANVFAINGDDGGVRWRWRSGSAGGTSKARCAKLDPTDGHLWVGGDRTNTWQGVTSSAYANLWKLNSESGEVMQSHDLGVGTNIISIDINPVTGLIAVGTLQPAA